MWVFKREKATKVKRASFRFKAQPPGIIQFKQMRREDWGKGAQKPPSVQSSSSPSPMTIEPTSDDSSSISSKRQARFFKISRFEIPTPVYPRSIATSESSDLTSVSARSGYHTPQRRPEPVSVGIKRRQQTRTRGIKTGERLFEGTFADIGEEMWKEQAAGPPPLPIQFVDDPNAQAVVAHAQIPQLPPDVALPRWSQLRFVPGEARITDAGRRIVPCALFRQGWNSSIRCYFGRHGPYKAQKCQNHCAKGLLCHSKGTYRLFIGPISSWRHYWQDNLLQCKVTRAQKTPRYGPCDVLNYEFPLIKATGLIFRCFLLYRDDDCLFLHSAPWGLPF